MEISKQHVEGFVEVIATGRLDAYWADHLSKELEEILRQGHDRIRMNMQGVEYVSSMGLRVLVTFYKKLQAIQGAFVIAEPSEAVEKVLDMVGLKTTLMAVPSVADLEELSQPSHVIEHETLRMEVFGLTANGGMQARTLGDPAKLASGGFTEQDCRTTAFLEDSFGVGLGAFGANFAECQNRFGEFLAVSGAAAYQPSDGSNAPDYLLAQGSYVPELQVLYGVHCQGAFASLGRFEVRGDARAVSLSHLAEVALEVAQCEQAALILVGESAGLVGAALRKPPVNASKPAELFAHPEIRRWLSFTTERAFSRALTVAVGVIARSPDQGLAPFVRPLNGNGSVQGHVHAAAFPYRPLQRGRIELRKTVRALFEQESMLGVLHLLGDDRGSSGVAESEFVRGACWIAPLAARA